MKKVVLKLDINDEKDKKKVMKTVTRLSGLESISIDMKEKKLTVTGEVDPVAMVGKLRKNYPTEIISVGPAKEPDKKKEEPNKKKDDPKKKKEEPKDQVAKLLTAYEAHQPPPYLPRYHNNMGVEEDPNACVVS
ncbi:hypothetical protein Ancab_009178 [Ancistrocladus abbreviatus]